MSPDFIGKGKILIRWSLALSLKPCAFSHYSFPQTLFNVIDL
jgi:hypothetical protein